MVGLVLVSHSKKLGEAVRDLVLQMTAPGFPVAIAGGVGDNYDELGTDAVHISEVLQALRCPDGVLVLMDLGSAVLSAQTALELLDVTLGVPVRLCSAPLVEGAIAAAVESQAGCTLDQVARQAELGLAAKQQQLPSEDSGDVPAAQPPSLATEPAQSGEIVLEIENPHGLHARPAAAFVQTVSRFDSSVEVTNLSSGRGPVPARSLTSLSLLQVHKGERIRVAASGRDCHAALQAIRELAAAGFGETTDARSVSPAKIAKAALNAKGFPGADGIAIGPLVMLQAAELVPNDEPAGEPEAEFAKLNTAMKTVRDEIQRGRPQLDGAAAGSGTILEAQALILSDPIILTHLQSLLERQRLSAAAAWRKVTGGLAAQYEATDDDYLRERAADIRDIARRLLGQMQGAESPASITLPHPAIVFTDELLPSEASACDPAMVLGVITGKGSATSHSAILLRTLGIPMVAGAVGIGEADAGKTVALNGSTGEFWIDPDAATTAKLEAAKQLQMEPRKLAERGRVQPSVTLDGTHIEVLANVGKAHDAKAAAENGAEGVGLLRTEFLFVSRAQAPREDEQVRALREIYEPISGPILVRTLDVGADKPLPFLPRAQERNPYLGVRGIRWSLQAPEMLLTHLRAILRSGVDHEIWLMFPMISLVQEVREALQFLEQAHQQLQSENTPHVWPIKRGIMIEVPSAALLTEQFAEHLDFFSVGTNDLTQYTMAAERGNAEVAQLQDALHPAVLRLMKSVVQGAKTRQRHVSICGDAASDLLAAAIFAGLGIHGLSVRANQVAVIKAMFRELRLADLETMAAQALECQDAFSVRSRIGDYLSRVHGLNTIARG